MPSKQEVVKSSIQYNHIKRYTSDTEFVDVYRGNDVNISMLKWTGTGKNQKEMYLFLTKNRYTSSELNNVQVGMSGEYFRLDFKNKYTGEVADLYIINNLGGYAWEQKVNIGDTVIKITDRYVDDIIYLDVQKVL